MESKAEPKKPRNLSREVLRWLQSLDLAYSVKNPKRDFANGFLVAEIFSRYYDKDVQMHSYDNGTAMRVRKDNWQQLQKFFRKAGLQNLTDSAEVDAIMHAEDGAVVGFVNKAYELLTQRKVQDVVKPKVTGPAPGYARETGSSLVKAAMKGAELSETQDDVTVQAKLLNTLDGHEKSLQEERSIDPERFSSLNNMQSRIMRGTPKAVGREATAVPQVTVKQIEVKQVDRSIAHLRAAQGDSKAAAPPAIPEHEPYHSSNMLMNGSQKKVGKAASNASSGTGEINATAVLNGCVMRSLQQSDTNSWDPRKDAYQQWLSGVCEGAANMDGKSPAGRAAAAVLKEMEDCASQLADAAISAPKQFWVAANAYASLLAEFSATSNIFVAAASAYKALGREMAVRDAAGAPEFFADFSMPKLLPILKSYPHKRQQILEIFYSFAPDDVTSHIQAIKRLQSRLDDLQVFIHCLALLVHLEKDMDEALLDLYLYYCIIGATQTSPSLRAASLGMLSVLFTHSLEPAGEFASQMTVLADSDPWWEVQGQLLAVCSVMIQEASAEVQTKEGTDLVELALGVVTKCFKPKTVMNVRKMGLSHVAACLSMQPDLLDLYLSVLHSLPPTDREAMLGLSEDSSLLQLQGGYNLYNLAPAPLSWDGLQIARSVERHLVGNALENIEPEQMQILASCVLNQAGNDLNEESLSDSWTELFENLEDYIFLALCDSECCLLALDVIGKYIFNSALRETVLSKKKFIGTLKLVYSSDDVICQNQVEVFLRDVFQIGEPYSSTVIDVLQRYTTSQGTGPLSELLTDLRG